MPTPAIINQNELDIGFEGISHPIMELVEYDELKDYLLSELHAVDTQGR